MNISISDNNQVLEIHLDRGLKLISIQKIIYIEAYQKGSVIVLESLESVSTKYLLKEYLQYLPMPHFFRCHYSYIVNCRFVYCFSCGQVILPNDTRVPLSRSKKQQFKENMIEFQHVS